MSGAGRQSSDADLTRTLHLVRGAQRGDAGATEALMRRYLPRVRRVVALRLGKRLHDICKAEEDLVQETLLSAWKHLDRFDAQASEASFRGWIATIAVNRIRDALRQQQRRGDDPGDGGGAARAAATDQGVERPGTDATPSEHAIGHEVEGALNEVICSLPGPYRQIVDLRDYVGLSYAEAAREMGRTRTSCRKLHQRAWEMIRERLDRDGRASSAGAEGRS